MYYGSGHKRMFEAPAEQRIRELEKGNAELRHTNDIPRETLVFFAQCRKKYELISAISSFSKNIMVNGP